MMKIMLNKDYNLMNNFMREQEQLIEDQAKTIREQNELCKRQSDLLQVYSFILGKVCEEHNVAEVKIPLIDLLTQKLPEAEIEMEDDLFDYTKNFKINLKK